MKQLNRYKSFCKFIKSKYPNVRIQRKKCSKKMYGYCKDDLIVIDNKLNEDLALMILIHELAHYLCPSDTEHDKSFGLGCYKSYKIYLEWSETWN